MARGMPEVMTPNVAQYKPGRPSYMLSLRLQASVTQVVWAERCGMSLRKLRRIETGECDYDYATQFLMEVLSHAR